MQFLRNAVCTKFVWAELIREKEGTPMAKKGSVTVFFALILSLMVSLLCAGMESVRMAAARTQTLCSMDTGLYSLFGQYDKMLLEDYDLFFLDGSCGGGELKMAQIYDNLESWMQPVLRQNGGKLHIQQGGFTGYRLATDEDGEVFYRQVVRYMQDTLGGQGVQLLLRRLEDRRKQTQDAEEAGNRAESGKSMDNYNAEMNQAAQNSREAQNSHTANGQVHGGKTGQNAGGGGFSDGTSGKVINPVTVIQRIRKRGILELVLSGGREISGNSVDKSVLVSGRRLQSGMYMPGAGEKDRTYVSQVLFQQYLMDKLGNYRKPGNGGLKYQVEYVLNGKNSDLKNLKSVARRLLVVREGINFAYLLSDSVKRAEARTLALAIAATFLIPPAAGIIEGALLLCWAFAESILDVRELFDGGNVPLVKSAQDWQISLNNLPRLLEGLDSLRKGTDRGMSYEDYLQVFLLARSKEERLRRGMDMVESRICSQAGRSTFRLDSCIAAVEASVDVAFGRRRITAVKQYCYD